MNTQEPWFTSWFDSPHYHRLYRHRDQPEARAFMHLLVENLSPAKKSAFLDVGCGNGRHASALAELGYRVTGLDLSENNVKKAKERRQDGVEYRVGDMRDPMGTEEFDYVLNLFTSFGFFENDADHQLAIQRMTQALKPGGRLIIDFMNTRKAERGLIPVEVAVVDGYQYQISRNKIDGMLVKSISFDDSGKNYVYTEKVQELTYADFERYLRQVDFTIERSYGNYRLDPFDIEQSDRLILIARRK